MQSIGIDTARTAVGDRYVLEEMRARGYAIGGEQSGHVTVSYTHLDVYKRQPHSCAATARRRLAAHRMP